MILFATYNDYSNLCYNFAESLKSIGIQAQALTLTPHIFGYSKQAIHVNHMTLVQAMETADLVIIGHSSLHIKSFLPPGKRYWVLHTGTPYRQAPDKMNFAFADAERVLTDSPEFIALAPMTYIAAAINTDEIKFSDHKNGSLTFAHYPSNAMNKGTDKICKMMAEHDVKFICKPDHVSHADNLKRISECDVYIELFATTQRGATYGSFGVTAFEAAALGKIVITNSLFNDVYKKAYGSNELFICNDEPTFHNAITFLKETPYIENGKKRSRAWIESKHNYTATGHYLKQLIDKG